MSLHIVHTESSCGWGGQEIRILEESRGMVARGHRVTILCPSESHIYQRALDRGLNAIALPIARKNLRGLFAMRAWLKANSASVINTHSSTDSWLAALANTTFAHRAPIVRTRHVSAPVSPSMSSRWLYGTAAKHVVTTGESLRQTLIQELNLPASQLTSVPTGHDTTRFAPGDQLTARQQLGLRTDVRWVGIVATLRSWKGHVHLLQAIAQLNDPSVHLVIVGDGPQFNAIHSLIIKLGLSDRVVMAGERSDPELWLRAFDIFCLPSYANEGVPQALVQAMLTGLPVISTPVGAILEALSNNRSGLIVEPKQPAQLAAAIELILSSTDLSLKLGRQARLDALSKFGFDSMIDSMVSIFESVSNQTQTI